MKHRMQLQTSFLVCRDNETQCKHNQVEIKTTGNTVFARGILRCVFPQSQMQGSCDLHACAISIFLAPEL